MGEGVGGADNKWNVPWLGKKPIQIWGQKKHGMDVHQGSAYRCTDKCKKKIIYKVMKTEHIQGQVLRKVSL